MNAELVTAAAGGLAAVLGAWALVVKARGNAARPKQLLRRLWDWVQYAGHEDAVPPVLAEEVRDVLTGGDES